MNVRFPTGSQNCLCILRETDCSAPPKEAPDTADFCPGLTACSQYICFSGCNLEGGFVGGHCDTTGLAIDCDAHILPEHPHLNAISTSDPASSF